MKTPSFEAGDGPSQMSELFLFPSDAAIKFLPRGMSTKSEPLACEGDTQKPEAREPKANRRYPSDPRSLHRHHDEQRKSDQNEDG